MLTNLLYDVHQQPRFGWRVTLAPLLAQYWQTCDPARRTPRWLRWHQRLRRRGEPRPLRLAPLHMDVHAGNIIHSEFGLRLIDWEYAGDGDIALELAAVWISLTSAASWWRRMPGGRPSTRSSFGGRLFFGARGYCC